MKRGKIINIENHNTFVDISGTVAYKVTYLIEEKNLFSKKKTYTKDEIMHCPINKIDDWLNDMNKKMNVWRKIKRNFNGVLFFKRLIFLSLLSIAPILWINMFNLSLIGSIIVFILFYLFIAAVIQNNK